MAKMMNLQDLIAKANGKNEDAKKALRREYKKAAAKAHPDHGGSAEQMAKLNEEYQQKEALLGLDEELRQAVEKILAVPGINIEICGTWVWVSGDTKTNKDVIKAAGYRWAHKKMMWYNAKAYDALTIRGKKGWREQVKAEAERHNESLNSYIMTAIFDRVNSGA